ncbi:MAG TPA: DNA recombination protein RmuC, partial [Terracidiphilus sp.]|nr:DNA recombination protein RmuC [Terracidiphilus sp.]
MTLAIVGVVAVLIGILLGYWLAGRAAAASLTDARSRLEQARIDSDRRAGFESLAAERLTTIETLTSERNSVRDELQAAAGSALKEAARISALEAELGNERTKVEEKLVLLDAAEKKLSDQFEALAGKILDEKTKSFSDASLKDLQPLRDQLKDFRDRVDKVQTESTAGVTKLETLIGTLGTLNQQLTTEAHNLTTALRGSSKAQGDWGELIARNLLEKAGLREGEHFRVQETFDAAGDGHDRNRKVRPDIIVNLPGGRHLIIDSKVSLNAYTDSVSAESDEERKAAIKRHLASVRAHVDELADRSYHKLNALETVDFVVMFVPIEPAFLAALHQDESLWRYAYEREVLLVGPTTLLFVIRIVDNLWQQELRARSVQDVMNRGTELYDKFVGFVTDLEAVGKSLRGADQSYTSAMNKLSEGRG